MSFDRKTMTDAEFERALLASADADAPPHDTGSAWTRFASMAGLTTSALPASVEAPRSEVLPRPTVSRNGRVAAFPGPGRGAALKWLLVGAVGGSVVTAAVMRQDRPEMSGQTGASGAVAVRAMAPAVKTDGALCAPGPSVTERPTALVVRPDLVHSVRHAKHAGARGIRTQVPLQGEVGKNLGESIEKDPSSLAAEVSRIDAARVALAGGDSDQAVRLIEQYHWDFPSGALAPDADVVALEAVAAKHDRAEVARRAALFLSRYPGDPHAARVVWLGGH